MTPAMRRRVGAEALGTFAIVFAPVALASVARLSGGAPGLAVAALVSGLAVAAAVCAVGPISAAHLNPAVTLAFAAVRRFPWRCVAPYVAAQFVGASSAAGLAALLFGPGGGTHVPAFPTMVARNLGTEASISFLLMLTIVAVATDRRASGAVPALAIGSAVVVGVLVGGPVTGGSMNPARSLGPALFAGGAALGQGWLYVVGPCVGAVAGALAFEAVRLGREHAQGAPNELFEALEGSRSA